MANPDIEIQTVATNSEEELTTRRDTNYRAATGFTDITTRNVTSTASQVDYGTVENPRYVSVANLGETGGSSILLGFSEATQDIEVEPGESTLIRLRNKDRQALNFFRFFGDEVTGSPSIRLSQNQSTAGFTDWASFSTSTGEGDNDDLPQASFTNIGAGQQFIKLSVYIPGNSQIDGLRIRGNNNSNSTNSEVQSLFRNQITDLTIQYNYNASDTRVVLQPLVNGSATWTDDGTPDTIFFRNIRIQGIAGQVSNFNIINQKFISVNSGRRSFAITFSVDDNPIIDSVVGFDEIVNVRIDSGNLDGILSVPSQIENTLRQFQSFIDNFSIESSDVGLRFRSRFIGTGQAGGGGTLELVPTFTAGGSVRQLWMRSDASTTTGLIGVFPS